MHTQKLERKKKERKILNWISFTPLSRKVGMIEMDASGLAKGQRLKAKTYPLPLPLFSPGVEASTCNLSSQEAEEEESGVQGLM